MRTTRAAFAAVAVAAIAASASCKPKATVKTEDVVKQAVDVQAEPSLPRSQFVAWERVRGQLKKFEPHEMAWRRDLVQGEDLAMLGHLIEAARLMDEIFLRQVSSRSVIIRDDLARTGDPGKDDISHFFRIMFGPYDRLDDNRPFINVPKKDKGATFYPANMSVEEFDGWVADHPADEKAFKSTFTVIRRTETAPLVAVPYSEEYAEWLAPAAAHLRKAAGHCTNESLARFLESRADAFEKNDYFQSDLDWVNVEGQLIDVTIGPYEVYEDGLMGLKASFEAYVCLRDPEQSASLDRIKSYLPEMEANLPIPDEHKNPKRGTASPIAVVDLIFSAGDAKAGIQTLAFNLPNDERVRESPKGGSKKVILRNTMNGKFAAVMSKISPLVVGGDQLEHVTFDRFFDHTLLHEISHGLGPGTIVKDGEKTEVGKELKELYSAIEEAKADTLGMYNAAWLVGKGFYPEPTAEDIWVSFMAGTFRSVRFGADEAHGKANVVIFNYLAEKGAYVKEPATGRFTVDLAKIEGAVRDLAHDLLMIEALGDYDGAKAFLERYGTMSPDMKALVDLIGKADIPVDIEPVFEVDDVPIPSD